jgi:hypothetical protein
MKLGALLTGLERLERELAATYRTVGARHVCDADIFYQCQTFALQCDRRGRTLAALARDRADGVGGIGDELAALCPHPSAQPATEEGVALLLDLCALFLVAEEVSLAWLITQQGAAAARDRELLEAARRCQQEAEAQSKWLTTRTKLAAPQALVGQ